MPASTGTTITNGGAAQAFNLGFNSDACQPISYSVAVSPALPAGGSAQVVNGQLVLTPPPGGLINNQNYQVVVTASNFDSNGAPHTDTWTLNAVASVAASCANPPAIAGLPATLTAIQGTAISQGFTVAQNDATGLQVTSSESWATITNLGGGSYQIAGTPPAAGTYNVVVTAADPADAACSDSATMVLTVSQDNTCVECDIVAPADDPACENPPVIGGLPASITVNPGEALDIPYTVTFGGPTTNSVNVNWLNSAYDSGSTHRLTGTAPASGTISVTVNVADTADPACAAQATFDVIVNAAACANPPTISNLPPTATLPDGVAVSGIDFLVTLNDAAAVNVTTSEPWLVATLIGGLPQTWRLSGMPPAGAAVYPVTVTAADSSDPGCFDTAAITITVEAASVPQPVFTDGCSRVSVENFDAPTATVSPGSAVSFTYDVQSDGPTFNSLSDAGWSSAYQSGSTHAISGTAPTAPGTYSITLTVTPQDDTSCADTVEFFIVVA